MTDMMSNPAAKVCPISILHEEPGFLVVLLRQQVNAKRKVQGSGISFLQDFSRIP